MKTRSQGAPFVCSTCNGVGHLKSECPTLKIPDIVELPKPNENWFQILSKVCQMVTGNLINTIRFSLGNEFLSLCEDRCCPRNEDLQTREDILKQLKNLFHKDCPDCDLQAFGSFYNGFGFWNSDLDVCFVSSNHSEQKVRPNLPSIRRRDSIDLFSFFFVTERRHHSHFETNSTINEIIEDVRQCSTSSARQSSHHQIETSTIGNRDRYQSPQLIGFIYF